MSGNELSEATAQFALDLLRQVGDPESDVFLSPASIAIALAMTYAGAAGNTAEQMKNTIFQGVKDDEAIHRGFSEIVKALNEPSNAYQLNTANRLYSQKDFQILSEYLSLLTSHYQSEIKPVDFVSEGENVRQEINSWVEEVTRGKIRDLVGPGVLDALTRLVIVNAIYFKGDWQHKFLEIATIKKTFYSAPNKETQVDMMRQTEKFFYTENDDVQVLGMPYKAGDLTMYVFLPKNRYGLAEFEKKITGSQLLKLMWDSVWPQKVIVEIPKFRLEKSFSLQQALTRLGMSDMFNGADFSKITGEKDLSVSEVIHKAFIEVNEEGSEAAAATVVKTIRQLCKHSQEEPLKFIADHPFFFVIVDKRIKALLFAGHFHA